MGSNRRKSDRVHFELGYEARLMGIDGTWARPCLIEDISRTGAKLSITGSIDKLNMNEFFLVLSRTGHPHRKCQMMWLSGESIGVRFLQMKPTSDNGERQKRRPKFEDKSPVQ